MIESLGSRQIDGHFARAAFETHARGSVVESDDLSERTVDHGTFAVGLAEVD